MVADKLSRPGQIIQKGVVSPSRGPPINMQQVAPTLNRSVCHRVQQATSVFVSPVPDPLAGAVDALSLPWENLDVYASPPAAILGKWW